jgi:hypothetical protein
MLSVLFLLMRPAICQSPGFVMLAEGVTADDQRHGMEVAYRMFSLPDLPRVCVQATSVSELVSADRRLEFVVNEWFVLSRLRITAVDNAGNKIARVPSAIEIEKMTPSLIDLRPASVYNARVRPVAAGQLQLRVRTLCPGPHVEILIPVTIRSR